MDKEKREGRREGYVEEGMKIVGGGEVEARKVCWKIEKRGISGRGINE